MRNKLYGLEDLEQLISSIGGQVKTNLNKFTNAVRQSSDETGIQLEFDVPGVRPEDIEIYFENGLLIVRSNGSRPFEERFSIPSDANPDNISARHELGVLFINIKRDAASHSGKINITVEK